MGDALSRRDFVKVGSAGLALGLTAAGSPGQETPRLRCAFIGVGGRGGGLLSTVLDLGTVDVVAVCDTTPENLSRALDAVEAKQGRRPAGFGEPYDYRQMLDSDRVDCCVIATPCDWHGRMYVDALTAGKPFYGEKPIAITAAECRLLRETWQMHPDVVAQIGFQWGAHRGRADAIQRVLAGEIGDLIEGRFCRHNGWASLGRWFNQRKRSGDWMLEQAVHEFNLLWWVIQEHPVAAYTLGRTNVVEPQNPTRDITDFYATLLEYPKGLIVHYAHGWISPANFGGMETKFVGTKGGLDVLGAGLMLQGESEPRPGQGPGGDTREHLQGFFDAVRAADPRAVFCSVENGLQASYVGLMIRKSLDEKRRVTFEEMLDDPAPMPDLSAV
jgi:predicted dehydrogenase